MRERKLLRQRRSKLFLTSDKQGRRSALNMVSGCTSTLLSIKCMLQNR